MTVPSPGVTRRLLDKLLEDQEHRALRERKMPFAEKLKVLDQLMAERFAAEKKAREPGAKLRPADQAGVAARRQQRPHATDRSAARSRKPRPANDR